MQKIFDELMSAKINRAQRSLVVLCLSSGLTATGSSGHAQNASSSKPMRSLSAVELFRKASPSVFVVESLDERGSRFAVGSAVAISEDSLVTNCHVIEKATAVRLKQGNKSLRAAPQAYNPEHDLCALSVKQVKLTAPVVRPSSALSVGERVYAIGAPEGLELTFSEGIISGLREYENIRLIQTSAAISRGSSGGGLFDAEGRLVGITTFFVKEGQNLNFALPGEWITALHPTRNTNSKTGVTSSLHQGTSSSNPAFDALLWSEIATKAWKQNDYATAEEAFKKAIALFDSHQHTREWARVLGGAMLWSGLASVYHEQNKYEDSAKAYEQSLRFNPNFTYSWVGLCATRTALVQWVNALDACNEAVRLAPDDPKAWRARGFLDLQMGEYKGAVTDFEKSVDLDPKDSWTWRRLGGSYLMVGNYDLAAASARHALELEPENAEAWALLGASFHKLGDRDGVSAVYQKLRALDLSLAQQFFEEYILR